MKIDELIITRIKEAAKIYDVVADFVKLRKTGVRYTGLCPFHEDRHDGNFVVYPRGNCYKCFACDAKGGPVEFLMAHEGLSFLDAIRYLGKKYNIDTDMVDFDYTPPPARNEPPPMPMLVLPMRMVTCREDNDNSEFVSWLRGLNWDSSQRRRVEEMLKDYHVGYSKQGMTIWWQIDERMQVRTGKMMRYKTDGHRDKDTRYNFDFIHSRLFKDEKHPEFDVEKLEIKQCLFGLHLLNYYKQNGVEQTVNLVESEKTALIMAIAYGNHEKSVWMATGGLEHLTRERLKPLIEQHRHIVCWPDRDGIAKWQMRIESLNYDRITLNTKPVTEWWKPEDGEKADIADVVIRMIQTKRIYKTVDDVVEDLPQLKKLHAKLNFEIENDREAEDGG